MTITYPVGTVIDDSGAIVTGATVTIASVVDDDLNPIASPGAVVVGVDGSDVLAGSFVLVKYDAEAKGEAVITLAISKGGSTITNQNASPAFYASKDPSRIETALPNGSIPDAVLAATVDTVALSTLLSDIDSWLSGKADVVDNGDGTYLITPKRRDNTTSGRACTYNPSTGART